MRIQRQAFARQLATVVKVVESRNTIPILATVRLVASDGQLAVTATDLDIEISGSIEADTSDGTLAACVDAKLLAAVVNKAGGSELDIALSGDNLIVKSGRNRSTLPVLPTDDFPTMAAGDFTAEFDADMSSILGPHAFAMSDEETRYYLMGVFLEPDNATATNGHKLSTAAFHRLADFSAVIVPAKTVGIVPKGKSKVRVSDTRIQLCTDDTTITSKLTLGTYPDWRRIMPVGDTEPVIVDNATLKAAVERVAVVTNDAEPAVKMVITSDSIALSSRGTGESIDAVPCTYAGPAVAVGFNARYISEVLSSLPVGDLQFVPSEGNGPVLFTSPADEARRVVCMPRRI